MVLRKDKVEIRNPGFNANHEAKIEIPDITHSWDPRRKIMLLTVARFGCPFPNVTTVIF